jgi:hypothetical protein
MSNDLEHYMLPCLNKSYFGVECMGCGLQRSLALILEGSFIEAFYMYPAIYSLIALFGNIALQFFFTYKFANTITNFLLIITGVMVMANYILKFIP